MVLHHCLFICCNSFCEAKYNSMEIKRQITFESLKLQDMLLPTRVFVAIYSVLEIGLPKRANIGVG